MRVSDISIERPVLATVLSLLLIVVGLMAYARLTLRELPAIDPPVVSVDVTYPGASAGVVETRVTQVLEDALAGIEGIETLQSRSVNGRASVTIEFTLDRDIEAAANDVRDAVSRVTGRLPIEADPPEVQKADSDSEVILWLNMSSTAMDTLQLTDYAERYVVDRLSALNGVSQIRVGGQQRPNKVQPLPLPVQAHIHDNEVEPVGSVCLLEGGRRFRSLHLIRTFQCQSQFLSERWIIINQ